MKRLTWTAVLSAVLLCAGAFGQASRGDGVRKRPGAIPPETEPGIPVTDQVTIEKCSGCHKADEKGNLTRISWVRTTPEGWEEAIKRMVRLNGLAIQPGEARHILTYLSADHGLAPEETEGQRWYLEMRPKESENIQNPELRIACASCHALARPQTWRRSATEWRLLVNMHLGYFPVSENNSFHARPRSDGYGVLPASLRGHETKAPVDVAMDYFQKGYDLHSAAWSNWRAAMRDPNLKGRWMIAASAPGKGRYYGVMTIAPGSSPNAFKVDSSLTRAADGSHLTFHGQSVVYTGFEWRGRSEAPSIGSVREVMELSPDQSKLQGRWFWGGYQEFGLNVIAYRSTADITVLGTDVSSLAAGSKNQPVKILGDGFTKSIAASDIDLGAGVHVARVQSIKSGEILLSVDVDPAVISGFRSVSVRTHTAPNALAAYDKIDYIKISDPSAIAHLGGTTHPKGYAQFEAIAFNRGLDGIPNTADDIDLGPVPVKWSMQEFIAHYNDDDKEYVGSISADGLFTPSGEGPNPQRRFSTNNTGDVWVVATYKDSKSGAALSAKSYLVVAVPVYMKWDEPETAQ